MARLCFSARSRSKSKNPIPIQAQKRLLSMGGPPEVTEAWVTLLMTASKRHEGGWGWGGRTQAFLYCAASTYLRKMFAELKGIDSMPFLAQSSFRKCKKTQKLQSDAQDWCQLHPDQSWSLPWELSGSISLRKAVMVVVKAPQAFILTCLLFPPSPLSAVRIKAQ